jgi:hypothetical protein
MWPTPEGGYLLIIAGILLAIALFVVSATRYVIYSAAIPPKCVRSAARSPLALARG